MNDYNVTMTDDFKWFSGMVSFVHWLTSSLPRPRSKELTK